MKLKLLHRIFGSIIIIVFLLTGQYMHHYHNHLAGMELGQRMLYRSRHIYILFAGLINIGIGSYFDYYQANWRRALQIVGSVLIAVASLLFVIAFIYEPPITNLDAPYSRLGIFGIFIGVLLHLITAVRQE